MAKKMELSVKNSHILLLIWLFSVFSNENMQNTMKIRSHESSSYPSIREVKAWLKNGIVSEKLKNIALNMAFQCVLKRKYAKYDENTFQ